MKNTFQKIFFLVLLFLGSNVIAQKKVSLIIAEYDGKAATNYLQNIVSYTFVNGAMVERKVIMSVPSKNEKTKADFIRFDMGKNSIYKNRYIITGIGNVIDLKNQKIVVPDRGEFVKASGDSLIFYTNDIFKGKYYSVLNTQTNVYQKVENANYNPRPRPDVEVDELSKPNTITAYYITGKKDVLVKDAGFGQPQPLLGDDVKRKFPIFWLNNTTFLYAHFPKNQQMVSIYKVGINKTVEKIADITEVPATAKNDFFAFAADGNVIYSCAKGKYLVDLTKKKVDKIIFENVGNDFSVEADENSKYGRIVKYQNNDIGKKWCNADNAVTTSGYAAFPFELVIGTERYPQGIVAWNNITQKWVNIESSSLISVIGWVEE